MPAVPPAQRWGTPAYCATCGSVLSADAGFCQICGAPVPSRSGGPVTLPPPLPTYPAPASPELTSARKKSRTATWVVVIVVVIIVAAAIIGVALAYHSYSFTITESPTILVTWAGGYNKSLPVGVQVSGSWTTPNGVPVEFTIYTEGLSPIFIGEGYSGSFSFTADYSHYLFAVESSSQTTVSVSGSYWAV